MPQLLKENERSVTKRMALSPSSATPLPLAWCCVAGVLYLLSEGHSSIKDIGFLKSSQKVVSARFTRFYKANFYKMKIKTYMTLKSYLLYVTIL